MMEGEWKVWIIVTVNYYMECIVIPNPKFIQFSLHDTIMMLPSVSCYSCKVQNNSENMISTIC